MLLIPTPTVADVTSELARCQLEAERLFPAPHNKGAQNWSERATNLQKRAENIEACMRRAGYNVTAECSTPLKTYESCMKIADKLRRSPTESQHRDADWNRICLDNEWDVQSQERLSVDCCPLVGGPAGSAGDMVVGADRCEDCLNTSHPHDLQIMIEDSARRLAGGREVDKSVGRQ